MCTDRDAMTKSYEVTCLMKILLIEALTGEVYEHSNLIWVLTLLTPGSGQAHSVSLWLFAISQKLQA